MDQKIKFIIIGLIGAALFCLFLFAQAQSTKQSLLKERDELKSENVVLNGKIKRLEDELRGNRGKIESLQDEFNKLNSERDRLQGEIESITKIRDKLAEELRSKNKQEAVVSQAEIPPNTDAYWAGILRAKADLEMQLSDIRNVLRSLKTENEALQRDKSALQLDINALRNDKMDLMRQLDYNQKLLDGMAQEVVRERNDKVKIQESFRSIKNESATLVRQLKSLNNRKAALDKKVQELQEGKSAVDRRVSEMETIIADKASALDNLKSQVNISRGNAVGQLADNNSRESVELPAIVVRSSAADKKETAAKGAFPGKILAVNQDNKFVVIDIGLDAGVKNGDTFNVYRDGKNIGIIAVIQARNDIAACDIKKESAPVKIGDNIK